MMSMPILKIDPTFDMQVKAIPILDVYFSIDS